MAQLKVSGIKNVSLSANQSASQSSANSSIPPIPDIGFVNAQYRFVMNPLGDYTVHFADPDMFVARFPRNLLSALT